METLHSQASNLAGAAGGTALRTTPQGFPLETDEGTGAWQRLVLATFQDPGQAAMRSVAFRNVSETLRAAFQGNQTFLVISCNQPDAEGRPVLGTFENELNIAGWPFVLNVPRQTQRGNYANVMIFKFCNDATLLDCVSNVSRWAGAENFNSIEDDGLADLSTWLSAYVQDGIARPETADNYYANFKDKVTNPAWTGILVVKPDIRLDAFPADVQGLFSGMDLRRFHAHHVGIDVAPVQTGSDAKCFDLGESSTYGLVDYFDAPSSEANGGEPRADAPPAELSVLSLRALFENTRLTDFQSQVQLRVNEILGVKVSTAVENLLMLQGHWAVHDGAPAYVFNTDGGTRLTLQDDTLRSLEIAGASLHTVTTHQEGNTLTVQARVSSQGNLQWVPRSRPDLLSTDEEKEADGSSVESLALPEVSLLLDFDIDLPTRVVTRRAWTSYPVWHELGLL